MRTGYIGALNTHSEKYKLYSFNVSILTKELIDFLEFQVNNEVGESLRMV